VFEVGDHRELGDEGQGNPDQVLIGERPAEKHEVRPEIQQLWCVNCRHVVCFVPEDDTSVDQNERAEGGDESNERVQDPDNVDQSLGLSNQFQQACDDRDKSFGIVYTKGKLMLKFDSFYT